MIPGGRPLDFAFMCLTAIAIWAVAWLVWPFFELVAPIASLLVFLIAVNLADGAWFAIRYRRRFVFGDDAPRAHTAAKMRPTGAPPSPAIRLSRSR